MRCIVSESANTQVCNIVIALDVKRLHRGTSDLHKSSLLPLSLKLVGNLQITRNSLKIKTWLTQMSKEAKEEEPLWNKDGKKN